MNNKSATKVVNVESVGRVILVKTKRAKHMRILIRPFKDVRVTVPYSVSFAVAQEFLAQNIDWLREQYAKMKVFEAEHIEEIEQTQKFPAKQARQELVAMLESLARIHGFEYGKVAIRHQKTRWGSCSGVNNINLNAHLITLPIELVEYVLLHELVHTRVKNHSREFWKEIHKYMPDAKERDKRLRSYKLPLL